MGFFGAFSYVNGTWTEGVVKAPAILSVDIHDSDIATVQFTTSGGAEGGFYLGFHPRDYFEDPAEGVSVDVEREAAAFCAWASAVVGSEPDLGRVLQLLAREGSEDDPEYVFVEEAVVALLNEARIPLPPELAEP